METSKILQSLAIATEVALCVDMAAILNPAQARYNGTAALRDYKQDLDRVIDDANATVVNEQGLTDRQKDIAISQYIQAREPLLETSIKKLKADIGDKVSLR